MSFYQNQDNARRKTGLLIFYFVTAVVLIVVAVNAAIFAMFWLSGDLRMTVGQWLQSSVCWLTAGATLAAIILGSLFRIAKLAKGGIAVAYMAGATALDPGTRDSKERLLINVVEEMAIASGTPVPRIFVMQQEQAINAFVAGTESNNTVLAVTRGCLEKLTRDELQGVVGHEFSHILNGDMGLNVRLIGILAGILFIGQIGEFLVRGSSRRGYYSRSSNKDSSKLVPLGLALMLIGYVGLFFGRLIKAAISRQREFLADASSVQFTRNPDGIASALYAIKHYSGNSLLMNAHAEDMNHMCFGETVTMHLSGLLATHPPIDERIRAIDSGLLPRLKARFRQRGETLSQTENTEAAAAPATSSSAIADIPGLAGFAAAGAVALSAQAVKSSVGQPTPEHYDYARQLHNQMPDHMLEQAHDLGRADILIYSLILLESPGLETVPASIPATALTLRAELQNLNPQLYLPLLDICLATLQQQDAEARKHIISTAINLIKVDYKITLSEFIYCFLVQQALADLKRPARSIKSYSAITPALATLFSALVQASGDSPEQQRSSFQQIMQYYGNEDYSQLLHQPPTPKDLNQALQQLKRLTPLLKQPVVDACVDCILFDGKAVLKELELLRAICSALECPLPPVIAGQS